MSKYAILVGLGDYYREFTAEYKALPFVYKNIENLQKQLLEWSWDVAIPIIDSAATKATVVAKFIEVARQCQSGDSMLFYFTGHGNRFFQQQTIRTFLVSARSNERVADFDFDDYLNEINYGELISALAGKDCHLITVIDCCYAMGLIDGYNDQSDFHTVIAASSENSKSYYNTNSLFFQAFSKCWTAGTFIQLKSAIERGMNDLRAPNRCKMLIAGNYQLNSLKN